MAASRQIGRTVYWSWEEASELAAESWNTECNCATFLHLLHPALHRIHRFDIIHEPHLSRSSGLAEGPGQKAKEDEEEEEEAEEADEIEGIDPILQD